MIIIIKKKSAHILKKKKAMHTYAEHSNNMLQLLNILITDVINVHALWCLPDAMTRAACLSLVQFTGLVGVGVGVGVVSETMRQQSFLLFLLLDP